MEELTCEEILEIISKGEDFKNQFKLNFESIDKLASEIVAFLNSEGGRILVGITNRREIEGLAHSQIDSLNQWIGNVCRNKIYPPTKVETQTIICEGKNLLVINVPKGDNKPYAVNKTDIWIKVGSDKRRATIEDIARLLQESGRLRAEENIVELKISKENLDIECFLKWYEEYYKTNFDFETEDLQKLFNNWELAKKDKFTLAGLLLFGKNPELIKPQFVVKAVYWENENNFKDKEEIQGNLIEQFKKTIDFLRRNLRKIQRGNVNAPASMEIPEEALMEAVANAIVHRDYFIEAPIYVEIWSDRVEVRNPGKLPNTLTIETIKAGIHNERNPIILSFLEKDKDFRYSGMGKGIPRIIRKCEEFNIKVDFVNDIERLKFKVIFKRLGGKP